MMRLQGECLTEEERRAMLGRIREIAESYGRGELTLKRAQHECEQVIAPLRRHVRRQWMPLRRGCDCGRKGAER